MRKLEGRALICLLLILAMIAGLIFFVVRLEMNGRKWAGFYANEHIFSGGNLIAGELLDRNGNSLLKYDEEGPHYAGEEWQRRAISTVTGDVGCNIETGANRVFRTRLVKYNPITGTEGFFGMKGGTVQLSIDKTFNEAAYEALDGRNGFVGVYDYTTGDIVCLVSTPTVDPQDPEAIETAESGAYINKVISATYAPGSTFKILTARAAIENIPDLSDRTFTCYGETEIGEGIVTCPYAHGTMDFSEAMANSCNCAFGQLAAELGPETMSIYVQKMGLTSSYEFNGIESAEGSFTFDESDLNVAWAGIGQYEDQVNPLSMMVMVGAIAGNGSAAEPSIVKGESAGTVELIGADTALRLKELLRNNVITNYGDDNYPGLEMGAKSGTAETGDGNSPHAWFTGYSGNYAFVVMVENGGSGADTAGPVANAVLQKINGQGE